MVFDLERLNELQFYDATAPGPEQGFRRILVTETAHPYMSAWWPPGHIIGYEHTFTHQVADFLGALAEKKAASPTFREALSTDYVTDAVLRSGQSGQWEKVARSAVPAKTS